MNRPTTAKRKTEKPAPEKRRGSAPKARPEAKRQDPGLIGMLCFPLVFLGIIVAAAVYGHVPRWIAGVYGGVSVLSFAAYGLDKSKAQNGEWRTPEGTLHLLDLFGGWPGAFIAQRFFRHKTQKQPFQAIYVITVIAHLLAGVAFGLREQWMPQYFPDLYPPKRAVSPVQEPVRPKVLSGELVERYKRLQRERALLDVSDKDAVMRFNKQAESYKEAVEHARRPAGAR